MFFSLSLLPAISVELLSLLSEEMKWPFYSFILHMIAIPFLGNEKQSSISTASHTALTSEAKLIQASKA